jgi:dihydrolipoamide dehydrogenase
MFRVIARRFSY